MNSNSNIAEKTYTKLTLQVSLSGFSFCVFDTLNRRISRIEQIIFSTENSAKTIEEHYANAILTHSELNKKYDEVVVLHDNNLSTFVPKSLFNEAFLGSYLQYTNKVFETDFFTYDSLQNYEMNSVYIPYININNYLLDQFGQFNYTHVTTILVTKLLDRSKNSDEKLVYVHFTNSKFEIVVVQNQKLLLFNSFEYKTTTDFIYYLLFTAEQLNLNPEQFNLQLLGALTEESEYFKIAHTYVRNVSLLTVSDLQLTNNLTTTEILKHFILLQS
jgi:hypothetical protein